MKAEVKTLLILLVLVFFVIPASSQSTIVDSEFNYEHNSFETIFDFLFPHNDISIRNYSNFQNWNISNDVGSNNIFQKANKPLEIPTYDGSGQLTHPSVLYFPEGWNGHKYWCVATPYPYSNDEYENPSIYCFDTPYENWIVPEGLTNPVVPQPSVGFNSDPCLAHNKTSDELYCIYRDYNSTNLDIKYLFIKSSDGISWSNPILLYNITANKFARTHVMSLQKRINIFLENVIHPSELNGATNVERSNAIVQLPNGTWMMWAQKWDSTCSIIYRTSEDCLHWSEPKNCSFVNNSFDRNVWHIEVKYIPEYKRFLMIQYSNGDKSLTLSESRDGINWKYYSNRILKPDYQNETNFANVHLYKSSFTYDPVTDTIHLWYVGGNTESEWKIGYTNTSYSRFT